MPTEPASPDHEPSPSTRRGVERRVNWRFNPAQLLTVALGVGAGLVLADFTQGVLVRLQGLLVILIVSLFISFGIEPGVKWLADRGLSRGLGTFVVFFITGLAVFGFLAAMAPLVVDQVTNLVENGSDLLDGLANQARDLIPGDAGESVANFLETQRDELPKRLPEIAPAVGRGALGLGQTLISTIIQTLTLLLVTFYLVADGPKLRRTLSSRMDAESQREFLSVWEIAVEKTGGYLYSRVLTAITSAVFHIVVFQFIGVPYAIALGVWVGLISSIIPVVGTYIAGALPLVIALAESPTDALWVLAAVILYQQVENYLVAPRITKHTLSLHPAVAFVSVLVGAALLGGAGALLALPATAIVSALIVAYGEHHGLVEHGLLDEPVRTPRPNGGNGRGPAPVAPPPEPM